MACGSYTEQDSELSSHVNILTGNAKLTTRLLYSSIHIQFNIQRKLYCKKDNRDKLSDKVEFHKAFNKLLLLKLLLGAVIV